MLWGMRVSFHIAAPFGLIFAHSFIAGSLGGGAPVSRNKAGHEQFGAFLPMVRSIVRFAATLVFFEHGLSKLFDFPSVHIVPTLFALLWFAGMIDFIGGILVSFDLFARPAAFLMSGEMPVGYCYMHAPHSIYPIINHGDAAILFCFIYIAAAGSGSWSLDAFQ